MMSKLKSLLLLCCFSLFGLSFVNAENGYFGDISLNYTTSHYNSNYSVAVGQYGNFFTSYGLFNKLLFMPGKGNFIFWSSQGIPYIYYSYYISDFAGSTYTRQGYSQKYFVCDLSDLIAFQSGSSSNLNSLNCSIDNITSSSVSEFSDFLSDISFDDTYYYYWKIASYNGCTSDSVFEFFFCFNSSSLGKSLCFGDSSHSCSNYFGGIGNGDLFSSVREDVSFSSIDGALLKGSPYDVSGGGDFTGGDLVSDSDLIFYSDHNQVYYDTFKALGFYDGLCYSNFELNDLFTSNTNYFDLFPSSLAGSGSSVFDLYNSWLLSSLNPFRSWYSVYNNKYNNLLSSSNKSNDYILSLYSGDSLGSFYLFDKLSNNSYIDSYDFSVVDYESFCSLVVNGFNPDGLFTGKTSISFDNIMTSSPCIRNGTCIGNVNGTTQFILSGSDSYGYFSGSTSVFDVFNGLYSNLKNAFRVDGTLVGYSGLLPKYIIFGFFMFVLLYVLKR